MKREAFRVARETWEMGNGRCKMGLAATGETLACFRRPLRVIYSFGLAPLTGYWIQTKPNQTV